MCGEKTIYVDTYPGTLGSPPHVRGKACVEPCCGFCVGITPACAGKRSAIARLEAGDWDHPRMCGEKVCRCLRLPRLVGSPPHVRGKVIPCVFCLNHHGITPAHAGKSQGLNIFHTKRSSGPSPAAVPAGPAGSCPASRPSQFPPRMTVISPRP